MKRGDMLLVLAALSGAVSVAAGAYGAHGASGKAAEWLRTGSIYQMVHAVAAFAGIDWPGARRAAWLFLAGAGIFALTLYAMALGAPHWLGAITPIGGIIMIAGWIVLAFSGAGRRTGR